jgi:hypothetical protein
VVVGAALVALLSGCSVENVGLVGLQHVGEHVHAVVTMCDGHTVDTLLMKEQQGTFRDEWTFDEPVTTSGTIDIGVFDDAVALIDTGNLFSLAATSKADVALGPWFTSDDLAALADGEILVPADSGSDDVQSVDKAGFDRLVESFCR